MLPRTWSTKHKYVGSACQAQLVHRLADKCGLKYAPTKRLISSFLESIAEELSKGHRMELIGLGVFRPECCPARRIQSSLIGGETHVPDHRGVQFRLSRHLKRLNESPLTPEDAGPSPSSPPSPAKPPVPEQARPKRRLRLRRASA